MQMAMQAPVKFSVPAEQTLGITATFTAEPLEPILQFWMDQLGIPVKVEFAPYNQVFQQLLDPTSLIAQNGQGLNLVLVRFEDWCRNLTSNEHKTATIKRNVQELVQALKAAISRSNAPYIVGVCPDCPALAADPDWATLWQQQSAILRAELSALSGAYLLFPADFDRYPVDAYYDAERDRLGHIPFTADFYTALGTLLARRIYALKSAPHKVVVLDCDNTIWQGVVGEDGVTGIQIPPGWAYLQQFIVAQQEAGMLICLCSKNIESDVMEVFDQRPDMMLKKEHLVSWRINWLPKAENLRSLAQELNLGLDSFIFIDDNPVECAQVRASCPEVLTLQLPIDDDIPQFLAHVWAFDHLKVTAEDKQRTLLYRQNLERDRFQQEAPTITDFLAGLGLEIDIAPPTEAQIPRVAQLTQRTNQFNFTTIRRSESDIRQLASQGLECRAVQVRDRFGDYGLVGVLIFGKDAQTLTVDSFLLSCRVLGRGVEHRMLAYLGEYAQSHNLAQVRVLVVPTKKNLPARNFMDSVAAAYQQEQAEGWQFSLPTAVAVETTYQPDTNSATAPNVTANGAQGGSTASSAKPALVFDKSATLGRIAQELWQPTAISAAIATAQGHRQSRPLSHALVAPRNSVEQQIADLWTELLHLDAVGVTDDYFDLGGTSLLAVEVITSLERLFSKRLPLTAIVEAPTVAQLAERLNDTAAKEGAVLLRAGGDRPPVFFIHDGFGEVLLYRGLALQLQPDHPIYGLQPYANATSPMLHTRIEDMATYYRQQIQRIQPDGPYLLTGMCAGGVLAFEVARQLEQQGQTVSFVGMLDAADVAAPKDTGYVTSSRWQRFLALWREDTHQNFWRRLGALGQQAWGKVANLVMYEIGHRYQQWAITRKLQQFQQLLDQNQPVPPALQHLAVAEVYEFAAQQYQPANPIQADIILFRASALGAEDTSFIELYSDPLFGWATRTKGQVKVLDVPGGHSSMLQEPNVSVLAQMMQDCLNDCLEPMPSTSSVAT